MLAAQHPAAVLRPSPSTSAYLVLFLASDEARYLTGQEFVINGGQTAHQPTYAQELERASSEPVASS